MLTIKDFTTDHEHLTDLLSVATYGNEWPVVKAFKSDAEKGLLKIASAERTSGQRDCSTERELWSMTATMKT